jgi:maltose O-acetyltransferase
MELDNALTERERMLAGALYRADDPELVRARNRARRLLVDYAGTLGEEAERRGQLLRELLAGVGADVWIEPPFHCDYGSNIVLHDGVYLNANCVILDCARVEIGASTLLGPAVQIYAATHPTDPHQRLAGLEYAAPVTIGENVWIGGGAIVGPGVSIGENTVIGAGSVVLRDVAANTVAVGNPCHVVRELPLRPDAPKRS